MDRELIALNGADTMAATEADTAADTDADTAADTVADAPAEEPATTLDLSEKYPQDQPVTTLDAHDLQSLFQAAYEWLAHNYELVNRLNVFPVPDGDTGTNMLLTIKSAWANIVTPEQRHRSRRGRGGCRGRAPWVAR